MSDSGERPELPDTWIEAANETEFGFYEVAEPAPSYRWAGGYGYSHDGPAMIEILAVVEGHEVSVETLAPAEAPPPDIRRSLLLQDLVHLVFDLAGGAVKLPLTLTLDEDDRMVEVDGEPLSFKGFAANGRVWLGSAIIGDGREIVLRDQAGVRPSALARCTNWAMADRGPAVP